MKKAYSGFATCLVAAVFLVATDAQADLIAVYDFTGGSLVSGDSNADTMALDLQISSGFGTPDFTNDDLNVGGNDTPSSTSSLAQAIANDQFASFTVNVPSTSELNLTDLEFDYELVNPNFFRVDVLSDKTGFTDADAIFSLAPPNSAADFDDLFVDLSGPEFQGLTDTTIEFRLYLADVSGVSSRQHILDNIELNGVFVTPPLAPEPASMVLWALIAIGLALCYYRRRRVLA